MPIVKQSQPRFLVVGAGGIGGIVASHLLATGHHVTTLSKNREIASALTERGFEVHGATCLSRVKAGPVLTEISRDDAPYDYVLLCTQPPQAEAGAREVLPILSATGYVVCFQNGLCEPRVARIVGEERVLGAVVAWGGSMLAPGIYDRTSSGGFVVGALAPSGANGLGVLASALASMGVVTQSANLLGVRWSKLAINCAISTLGTIAGERLGALLASRYARRLALEIITEVTLVASREGVRLDNVEGTVDVRRFVLGSRSQGPWHPRLWLQHAILLGVGMRYRRLRSSMLAALERDRPPAVDFLNGEVVAAAERHGIEVPINRAAKDMVWRIARAELVPSMALLQQLYRDSRSLSPLAGRSTTSAPVAKSTGLSEAPTEGSE